MYFKLVFLSQLTNMDPIHLNMLEIPNPDDLYIEAKFTHFVNFNDYHSWIENYVLKAIR